MISDNITHSVAVPYARGSIFMDSYFSLWVLRTVLRLNDKDITSSMCSSVCNWLVIGKHSVLTSSLFLLTLSSCD